MRSCAVSATSRTRCAIKEAIICDDQGICLALCNHVKCRPKIRFPGRVDDLDTNTKSLCLIIQILQLHVDVRRFGVYQRRDTHKLGVS